MGAPAAPSVPAKQHPLLRHLRCPWSQAGTKLPSTATGRRTAGLCAGETVQTVVAQSAVIIATTTPSTPFSAAERVMRTTAAQPAATPLVRHQAGPQHPLTPRQ